MPHGWPSRCWKYEAKSSASAVADMRMTRRPGLAPAPAWKHGMVSTSMLWQLLSFKTSAPLCAPLRIYIIWKQQQDVDTVVWGLHRPIRNNTLYDFHVRQG